MRDESYTRKLEAVIKQMLQPLKGIPFGVVIEGISGYRVIPFDKQNQQDVKVLQILSEVAALAGNAVNKKGILRPRPNEVGNDIEPFVKEALNFVGYAARIPATRAGNQKAAGYPDIEFTDEFGRANYLECKTFNIENVSTTQRSFYLSPSENFKVTRDAHHYVMSFEISETGRVGNRNVYKCASWKILSIENLEVDVKYEFNSDNARLYAKELILAEGRLD